MKLNELSFGDVFYLPKKAQMIDRTFQLIHHDYIPYILDTYTGEFRGALNWGISMDDEVKLDD